MLEPFSDCNTSSGFWCSCELGSGNVFGSRTVSSTVFISRSLDLARSARPPSGRILDDWHTSDGQLLLWIRKEFSWFGYGILGGCLASRHHTYLLAFAHRGADQSAGLPCAVVGSPETNGDGEPHWQPLWNRPHSNGKPNKWQRTSSSVATSPFFNDAIKEADFSWGVL